ncbi:hypothetical protein CBER1_06685 [Cercospora berteroae]|uniref:Uncharacterized protein n=1 Tax=Cercospora berteroae TaxID=357750 RepID=A0A2S6CFS2_9PEZI|nr:hypothetical protein CBER1_06685 [Cercospora berteroae]
MATSNFTLQHPDIHVGLRDNSLAYKEYFVLDSLPHDAPFFDLGPNGYPIVNIGERFCRWGSAHWSGRVKLCGSSHVSRTELLKHIEEHHGLSRQDRPPIKMNHNRAMCLEADGFYRTVMNHGAPKSVYLKDLLREQGDQETALQEERMVPRAASTAVVLRNNSVVIQPEPTVEADLESELRVIDAELVVGELKVKRLEAEERLAETKLRKKLSNISDAYRQYYQSDSLPERAPQFGLDANGYPIVTIGEVFCRWPRRSRHQSNAICARRFAGRNDLLRHIEEKHGVDWDHRLQSISYHDKETCDLAHAFYRALMNYVSEDPELKGHIFVDHFVAERMTPGEDIGRGVTSPTWSGYRDRDSIAVEPREDNGLNEEEIGPVVEDNNFTVEENGSIAGGE